MGCINSHHNHILVSNMTARLLIKFLVCSIKSACRIDADRIRQSSRLTFYLALVTENVRCIADVNRICQCQHRCRTEQAQGNYHRQYTLFQDPRNRL